MEESASPQVPAKNNNFMFAVIIGVVILAGVGFFLATKPKQSVPANNTATMSEPTKEASSPSGTVTPSGATQEGTTSMKTVTVSAKSFSFTPSTITVKKGQQVKIVFQNTGGFHDFRIDEFNVKTPQITANNTAEVTFTPDKAGTFEYYCSVGNHRAMGMVGKLIVQ
jgi:plastocyanin